jgi:hypothetical protein
VLIILLVVLLCCGGFGAWGHGNPAIGPWGWSPAGLVLVVLLVWFFMNRM